MKLGEYSSKLSPKDEILKDKTVYLEKDIATELPYL